MAVGCHLQGPNFGLAFTSLLGGKAGKRMKAVCLLPIQEVPEASFPRAGYLESSMLPQCLLGCSWSS